MSCQLPIVLPNTGRYLDAETFGSYGLLVVLTSSCHVAVRATRRWAGRPTVQPSRLGPIGSRPGRVGGQRLSDTPPRRLCLLRGPRVISAACALAVGNSLSGSLGYGVGEAAQVLYEQVGLFHGGEVAASVVFRPVHDVGEVSVGQAPDRQDDD